MEELIEIKENEIVETVKDSEVIEVMSYWTCDGDSDTGCLMSDPQNCVRG